MKRSQHRRFSGLAENFAPGRAARSALALVALLGGWLVFQPGASADFLPPVTSPGGGDSIAAGDVDLDGYDDVAVIAGNNVLVSLSTGNGAFQLSATLTGAKGSLFQVFIRDENNDGKPDVVALGERRKGWVNTWGGLVRAAVWYTNIWEGRGDGTFGSVTTSSMGQSYYLGVVYNPTVAFADFNRDGIADRAGVDGINNVVYVGLGMGGGSYQPPITFAAGTSPGSIAVGDFNGDGWTDIVVVNDLWSNSPTLSVLLNDSNW